MASGHSIMPRVGKRLVLTFLIANFVHLTGAMAQNVCEKPLYLTFDTGHMEVAPLIADVLRRQKVKVTFFAANERTVVGDGSLGNHWSGWWKARAAEGHEFASHTYDHVYWRGDERGVAARFRVRATEGAFAGRDFTWDAKKYCDNVAYAAERLEDFTGKKPLPLFRAPGGKTSAKLLAATQACGYKHVGWAPAGFLGDELPSEKFSNDALLKKALRDIQPGDILMAHLGIWSRKDPWAPAVLEPLIVGLKEKGFCFDTLRNHPDYKAWIATH
ncbi:MAG: peptidase A8 [Betaproteobacteria bacterium HGW-Betaproteobacteria-3]|nr:MAG: peptidase A8 [Betaproteobacteria bacterium HGW-Betaproteobacteria-3]